MRFLSIREFRASTAQIKGILPSENIVLTSNGKPVALIVGVNESNFESTLEDLRIAKARRTIREIQDRSERSGLSEMSLEEINAEIEATRKTKAGI